MQSKCEKQVSQLENSYREQQDKLAKYERLESELDDVIIQAAEGRR